MINCKICKIDKPESEYNSASTNKNKLRKECKKCRAIKNREYYKNRKDLIKECTCGVLVKSSNWYEHKKTYKHKELLTSQQY